jgi:TrmH family RNA methyltransferase
MRAASDTETPQGILAVLTLKELPIPEPLDFALVVDGVRDPGNLGSILRSAAAAAVEAVLLPPGAADPFAPKVVRGGMGAHFRLPIHQLSWDGIYASLEGLQVFLAAASGELDYFQADFRSPLALVIGSEAQGASSQARQLATAQVYIPMPGGSESLNAAVAAGVLMFEVVRQRALDNKHKDNIPVDNG